MKSNYYLTAPSLRPIKNLSTKGLKMYIKGKTVRGFPFHHPAAF